MNRSVEGFRQLERTMLLAWPAFEEIDYDGWTLRFADGYTKRANSVNPHFGSSLPLMAKIEHCEAAYRDRDLPTIFRLTPFSQPADLDQTLASRGYERCDPTLVLRCSLDRAGDRETSSARVVSSDQWHQAFDSIRGFANFDRESHRRIIESAEGECSFAVITEDGAPRACGLGVLVDDAVGLFDLLTDENYRRRGHGSTIMRSILGWAYEREASMGFLQVHSLNIPARRLYERFGFEVAYPYWYRVQVNRVPNSGVDAVTSPM